MRRYAQSFLSVSLVSLAFVACTGAEKDVDVPQPKPIAVIPGAAEVQIDDDVLIERDARVRARIDVGLREGWMRARQDGTYELRFELRHAATGATVGYEWRPFNPFKEWT